jgi:hypothetical protein
MNEFGLHASLTMGHHDDAAKKLEKIVSLVSVVDLIKLWIAPCEIKISSKILVVRLIYKSLHRIKFRKKNLTNSITRHVSANKITTRVDFNKKI